MMPSVAATTAVFSFLPVANAFGVCVGTIAIFGIGMLALRQTLLTMLYSLGASAFVTDLGLVGPQDDLVAEEVAYEVDDCGEDQED